MVTYTVECTFELTFQPAMKKTPERLQEIVADELGVDPIEITSMEVNHDIPKVKNDGYLAVMLEDGKTTISGSYEAPVRH